MSPQTQVGMHPSWRTLWTEESQIETMLSAFAPSPFQRQFLQGLTPVEAPAIGLELSKSGLRRRPHLAAWVLNGRLQRWKSLLQPLLREDGTFASGLVVNDLQPFLQAQNLFRQETWLELTKPARRQAGQPFLLFRQTLNPVKQEALKARLEELHSQLCRELQQRLPLPTRAWWLAVNQLPLAGADQLGIDLAPQGSGWRFLFGVNEPISLLEAIDFPQELRSGLERFPLAIALESRFKPHEQYALEIFPRYRQHHTIVGYPGEVPSDESQWPTWPEESALLPQARLAKLTRTSVHIPSVDYMGKKLTLRGGLSHQKLIIANGQLIDHKAYVGVIVTGSKTSESHSKDSTIVDKKVSPFDHAIDCLANAKDGWKGFSLSPGPSDRWIPLACLTLLANRREDARLKKTYEQQAVELKALLNAPQPIGYNQSTPADLDSSIWLRRCLLALGHPSSALLDKFLDEGIRADTGLRTYPHPKQIAKFIKRPLKELNGWCSPHDCVLANWASDPTMPQAGKALAQLRNRLDQGLFCSYWWPLDGLILSLLPRGSLPRSALKRCLSQAFTPAVANTIPIQTRDRFKKFCQSLILLRHGTALEQKQGEALLEELVDGPEAFQDIIVMQLPQPDQMNPKDQRQWHWQGSMEGALAPECNGFLAAAFLLAAQPRSK